MRGWPNNNNNITITASGFASPQTDARQIYIETLPGTIQGGLGHSVVTRDSSGYRWVQVSDWKSDQRRTLMWICMHNYYCCNNHVESKFWFCVNAWAWHQRHSHINCLITEGSTWDWDNCLLFMLLLCVVIYWLKNVKSSLRFWINQPIGTNQTPW